MRVEAGFASPGVELCAGVVEPAGQLDEHVQRHQEPEGVRAAGIVDDVSMATRIPPEGSAAYALSMSACFPVSSQSCRTLPKKYDVGRREVVHEEVPCHGGDALRDSLASEAGVGDRHDWWEVEHEAGEVRIGRWR